MKWSTRAANYRLGFSLAAQLPAIASRRSVAKVLGLSPTAIAQIEAKALRTIALRMKESIR